MTVEASVPVGRCPVVGGVRFNPLDPAQAADPYPWMTQARAEAPVFFFEDYGVWCVTRYADIIDVLRQPTLFSNRNANTFRELSAPLREVYPDGHPGLHSMFLKDPPEHSRIRKLVNRALTPRAVAGFEPSIRERAVSLIDGFVERGTCDLIADFSKKLAAGVIVDIVGVPSDLGLDFHRWGQDYFALLDGGPELTAEQEAALIERARRVMGWLRAYVDERRSQPGDDLISGLIVARGDEGEPALSDDEVIGVLNSFLVAGVETSATFIPLLVRQLLSDGLWERVCAEPALLPSTIEEGLRFVSPVRSTRRFTTAPVTVGGVSIPAGEAVQLLWVGAERDETVFEHPDDFDMNRPNVAQHLGFGRLSHVCIGAPLARAEARVAVEELGRRLAGLALDRAEEVWRPHPTIPSPEAVTVVWRRP